MSTDIRIMVKSVVLTRLEGPSELCNKPVTFSSFIGANVWLLGQASTFPKAGGYDKVRFVVTFEDGETYTGRLDCKYFGDPNNDLDVRVHVREFLEFYAGVLKPRWMKPEQYEASIAEAVKDGTKAEAIAWLAKYDI